MIYTQLEKEFANFLYRFKKSTDINPSDFNVLCFAMGLSSNEVEVLFEIAKQIYHSSGHVGDRNVLN